MGLAQDHPVHSRGVPGTWAIGTPSFTSILEVKLGAVWLHCFHGVTLVGDMISLEPPQFLNSGKPCQHSPPTLPTSSSQMKFSLEKLHQGITVSDPPFDSQPRPDDSFS